MSITPEPASEGQLNFLKLKQNSALMGVDDPTQSEADTRAKLIDPIFKDCLGWPETLIQRETPVANGFADYTFGTDRRWFHVEAKRTKPRFHLHIKGRRRQLALSGAHLLKNPKLKPLLEQAARYSLDLGSPFAVLTNGSQFILFETFPRGTPWRNGLAIVFHDHEDIYENFAEFYSYFGRASVERGYLTEAFARGRSVTAPTFTALQYIHNPDSELIRNPFWNNIAAAFGPILLDQPENESLQIEIITNCYVTTPLAKESNSDLSRLLKDMMPTYLIEAGVRDNPLPNRGPASFRDKVVDDLKSLKPGTYILTGGVGSGKTSFLRRFAFVDQHDYIKQFCLWIQVDYLEFGNPVGIDLGLQVRQYTYKRIIKYVTERYAIHLPTSGEAMRILFAEEIEQLKLTTLFRVSSDDPSFDATINRRVGELAGNSETYAEGLLRYIRKRGRSIVFVLDNTDQLGELVQREVFLLSQNLSEHLSTLSVVSLREEKFFTAYRHGVFDAYGSRKFHIGSPNLIDVLRRRLEYGITRYKAIASAEGMTTAQQQPTIDIIDTLIDVSTQRNGNIIRFLESVSAGDMRLALRMFHDFMSSGNTHIEKIQKAIATSTEPYNMPFHEFAKSAILGVRRYYRGSVGRVLNVFSPSAAPGASYWTCCRILARLSASVASSSRVGEGFADTSMLVREYRESFATSEDFYQAASRLLTSGLIESEPPRLDDASKADALRLTATGAYYWWYLIRSFVYIDLVLVDTPLYDESLTREFAECAERTREELGLSNWMRLRIEKVQRFLSYLSSHEMEELTRSSLTGGPYRNALCDEIRKQIEAEIGVIRRKTGA